MTTSPGIVRNVRYPLAVTTAGDTAMAGDLDALEALIEELLFTVPGERLNRPTLGCGVMELVFDAMTDELRAATSFQIQGNLQQWLGSLLRVGGVETESSGGALTVTVTYQPLGVDEWRSAVFRR